MHFAHTPSLLPDEFLYSLLGRLRLLNALERPQKSLRQLIGGHLAVVTVDLSSRLVELHARLGAHSPVVDPGDMLERCTLFPYHRAFLPFERVERVAHALLHGPATTLKSSMGLAANGFGATTTLRYCPQCAREDHHRHGTSYWRRAHHLPGVTVCAVHGLTLVKTLTPSRSGNPHALVLPPWEFNHLQRGLPASPAQFRFASLSAQALHRPACDCTETYRAAVYQRAAVDQGFAGARARIDYAGLANAILVHHDRFRSFVHQARLLATETTPLAWLRPLLTRPQRAMHPICHLVLIDFLFGSWAAYERAMLERDDVLPASVLQVPKGLPRNAPEGSHLALDPALSCREAARLTNLCVTTVATRRRAAGIHVASRRKTVCGPVLERVHRLVLDGRSPAQIAERTGVSISTAYRIRREHEDVLKEQHATRQQETREAHREAWLREGQAGMSVKAARQRKASCYAWLYRNDRAWLTTTNARFARPAQTRTRVDWAARDRTWTNLAEAFASDWRAHHPRGRLSPSAMKRALGDRTLRFHRLRLPMLHRRIEAVCQTRPAFQSARLTAAVLAMAAEGADMPRWRVLRRAGLRAFPQSDE